MRTDDFRPSDNIEDDREASAAGGGGFGMGFGGGAGGLGIGGIIVIALVSWYFGIDPSVLLNGAGLLGGAPPQETPQVQRGTPTDPTGRFVALVLGDTEDRWAEIFNAMGRTYHPPRLRLYVDTEPGGCGLARSAMGPFYCPNDQRIYLDTGFFRDLQSKFGGCTGSKACRFSEAYVIAHEVGHHVQDELGILPRVTQAQRAVPTRREANALQVRVELQADCFAGVWAHAAQQKHDFLDPGDVDQALQTASAIGDDRLQRDMQGHVVPDSFTHGTSAQRKRWFSVGLRDGTVTACDTFAAKTL